MKKPARIFALAALELGACVMAAAASQTITFDGIPNQIFGVSPFVIAAQASSGLPVSFASTTPAVCSTASNLVMLLSAGTCSITANSSAAAPVTRSFTVIQANPSSSFAQSGASPFAAGNGPSSIATGDFNGDGIQDVAVANGEGTVTVLLGNGLGGFAAAPGSPFIVGISPQSLVVGDFNGDGYQDLATADSLSSTVTVLLGNGMGGFTPAPGSPIMVGTEPYALAVGDFNGDGIQDIVVDQYDRSVIILLGTGSGAFAPSPSGPLLEGQYPAYVAVGDFNGDGIQDLAISDAESLTVLLGNGSGGFTTAPGSPIAAVNSGVPLVVADFNRDGIEDLAALDTFDNNVRVLLGSGGGGFTAAPGSPFTVGATPAALVAGDFNGDGIPDLATVNEHDSDVTVLLGNGAGGFAAISGSPYPVGYFPDSVAAGDFNGDGIEDLAVANVNDGTVTILLGFLAGQTSQTISFGPQNNVNYGVSPFTVSATASSGLGVTFVSTTYFVCTVAGNTVTVISTGTCSIMVSQPGNAIYAAAAPVTQSFAVNPAPQTITFAALNNQTISYYGETVGPFSAVSSAGLPLGYTSSSTSVCALSGVYEGFEIQLLTAGICSITATQSGGGNYSAAIPVTQQFTVSPATQTITFEVPSNVTVDTVPFTVSAYASSGLAVSFASSAPSVCTVTPTGTITILAGGVCSITANQAGNATYAAATPVTRNIISGSVYELTTLVSPSDLGTITLNPASWENYYAPGSVVCLTAGPAPSQIFIGWTGAALNAAGCLTMTANVSVTANFQANPIGAASALRFVPVTPCRIVDTRNSGPSLSSGSTHSFTIAGTCNIPSTALAYSLNLTVVPHGTLGYVSMWPTGQPQPVVSTLNSLDGRIKSNAAIVPAGTGGAVSVFATDTTDAILDINGYFDSYTDPAALQFYPLTPCRVADTRSSTGSLGGPSLLGSQSRSFPILSSACNIPGNALAYSLNFTAIPQGPLGYLTVWPSGQSQPLVSTLNAPTGAVTANAAIVPAGAAGAIELFATDNSDMAIDINGYFAAPASGGLSLYNLTPCRIEDTRLPAGTPAFTGTVTETATGVDCGVPPEAQSLVLNATVVPSGELGYLSLWANGASQPVVSTLNALDGSITSNMAVVPTTNGLVDAFAAGTTYLILDISGYFAP